MIQLAGYHESLQIKNARLLNERLKTLPVFLSEFFVGKADTLSSNTKKAYAYDFSVFFTYLTEYEEDFSGKTVRGFTLEDFKKINIDHIERYLGYLSFYEKDEKDSITTYQNKEKGKSRKLSSIRTLFVYFYKKGKIPADPSQLMDFPKAHKKNIIRLEVNEAANLLDQIEKGESLSKGQKSFHEKTKARDLAIVTLLLGTGLRVSECVGININDIDFDISGVKVTRKGGNESIVYFGDEVKEALLLYFEERKEISPLEGHEEAFFLSMQNRRITTRAVQNLVKKYAKLVTPVKNISPHKLRSTYGTNLYNETGDIYLVAEVLGHSDVNTTKTHYAAMEDMKKRQAAKAVRLRNE